MSDTDRRVLDLAEASRAELAEFCERHGVALERVERCQEYMRTSAPIRVKFELLALARESQPDTELTLVLRLVRDDGAWVELPTDFPSEHLTALLEILEED